MDFSGYYSGLGYPAMFHRELTPLWLTATVESLGFRPPDIDAGYTWCELGCGPGSGLSIAAAANPGGRFIGVDVAPAHVATARRLAARAGLANIEFHQADFVDWLAAGHLPPCDFIVLHGVFSWIAPEKQRAVLEIVRRSLKPGGLCYLAYMSHPGAAPLLSLQQLLAGQPAADAEAALHAGFSLLDRLAAGGAGQFVEIPGLAAQVERLRRQSAGYLAHEFFSAHWQPLHASAVIRALAAVACDYLGSATPLENIDAVSLPLGVQGAIRDIAEPALREVAKDVARNQSQRRDIYQHGRLRLTEAEHRAALSRRRWCLLPAAPAPGAVRLETRIGPVDGAEAVFAPLLASLAEAPKSFAELLELPAFSGNGGVLNQALQMMLWAGWVHPLQATADLAACRRLNRVIAADARLGHEMPALAAATIGSGVPAKPLDLAVCHLLQASPQLAGEALADASQRLLGTAVEPALLAAAVQTCRFAGEA